MTTTAPPTVRINGVPHSDSSHVNNSVNTANTDSAHAKLTGAQKFARYSVLVAPLVLVNAAAIFGQVQWAAGHLTGGNYYGAALFALTLESIAVYLAYEAHAALISGDASFRLRAASYLAAGVVGTLNYSHFAVDNFAPTTAAVAFGGLSTISPWLWSIRSRSLRRDQLRAAGLIDPRSAHFAAAKWINFPIRTLRAYRWSVDHGVQQERTAWEAYRQSRKAAKRAGGNDTEPTAAPTVTPAMHADSSRFVHANTTYEQTVDTGVTTMNNAVHTANSRGDESVNTTMNSAGHVAELAKLTSAADAVRYAFDTLGNDDVPAAMRWLREHGRTDIKSGNAYRVRRARQERRQSSIVALPTS